MIARDVASDWLARFGSPAYVYDLDVVERRVAELRAALPAGARIFYSVKANPLPSIVATLAELGLAAEVSSLGELQLALAHGFEPRDVLFTGPGKSESELAAAVAAGVTWLSCESTLEFSRATSIAHRLRRSLNVLLRLHLPMRAGFRLDMSRAGSQFGMDSESLSALWQRALAQPGPVRVAGVHVYAGTQVGDVATLSECFAAALEGIRALCAGIAVPEVIDFGGGFPWPYAEEQSPPPDLGGLRARLDTLLAARAWPGLGCWFESGRYLSASCGTLLTTVVDVKRCNGKAFVVVDAGINHLGGMGGLRRVPQAQPSIRLLRVADDSRPGAKEVVGPLCTPLDYLARDWSCPDIAPGDVLAVPNVGAYGASASLHAFLSRPAAVEISCRGAVPLEIHRLRSGHERIALEHCARPEGAMVHAR